MKTAQIDNFIGVFDGHFSKEYCDELIKYFDWSSGMSNVHTQKINDNGLKRTTNNLPLISPQTMQYVSEDLQHLYDQFMEIFWGECYSQYREKYQSLNDMQKHTIYSVKMQRTNPGEGYHVWHCENTDYVSSKRVALFILYLNDVPSGGETEFLYQHQRVEAKTGRLLICPAYYTHPHRGNPPLEGTKYILNGWVEFTG
jgi:hypothetical protein